MLTNISERIIGSHERENKIEHQPKKNGVGLRNIGKNIKNCKRKSMSYILIITYIFSLSELSHHLSKKILLYSQHAS